MNLLHEFRVGEIDVIVAIVLNRVLILDAATAILLKGYVVVQSALHPPLDGLGELKRTQPLHLA
jgi:hypothetical protein